MSSKAYVVDRNLGAVKLSQILDVRSRFRFSKSVASYSAAAIEDRPVLAGTQKLAPGKLYPSSKTPTVRYYLPKYVLATGAENRPEVQLRFAEGDAGEVGRLTVTVTWKPPPAGRMHELRMMDHVADLVLLYRIPVSSDGNAAAGSGGWEETVPLQPLQQQGGNRASSTTLFTDKGQFDKVYQAMREPGRGAVLQIKVTARVGIRTWNQLLVGQAGRHHQAAALQGKKALFTNVLSRETTKNIQLKRNTASAKVRVAQPAPEATRLDDSRRRILMRPDAAVRVAVPPARLRVAVPATPPVAGRTPVVARPGRRPATPPTARVRLRRAQPEIARVDPRVVARVDPGLLARMAGAMRVRTPPEAATHVRVNYAAAAAEARPQLSSRSWARVNRPVLSKAVSASDRQIKGRKVIPTKVALDAKREPAIIDTDMDSQQDLPFSFDPALPVNRDVFATEGFDSGGIHLLLRRQLRDPEDGKLHTIYQDNLMREMIHMAPSEFRLVRDEISPFLPALSFLASDFTTSEDDADAEVLFQVAAVYRLEPWVDPNVIELARRTLAQEGHVASFLTIVPRDAKLALELDLLGEEQQRVDAVIDPDSGVTDTLEFSHDQFVRLWRERLAPQGGEIRGQVEFKLFDGTIAKPGVRLSLWESSSELFDVGFAGPVAGQADRYRVVVRNRIESPAVIELLPGDVVPGGAVAHALDAANVIGQRLLPQQVLEIDYQVTPAGTAITSLSPTVVGRAEPNLSELLKLLMVTPGYNSLSFSLTVRAADGAFGPAAAGDEPIVGLMVEFDDGTKATLSADLPEAELTLVGRLIDQILGTADDQQRYLYRVTNLHPSGEGARTGWEEGFGTADVTVGTAVARLELDF